MQLGPLERAVMMYLFASVVVVNIFVFGVRNLARRMGEALPWPVWPGQAEAAYDRAMNSRGKRGHARVWLAVLLINFVVALAAMLLVVVPAMKQSLEGAANPASTRNIGPRHR